MKVYVKAREATDNNIIRCMRIACWMTKATVTHTEYVILIVFHGNISSTNALKYYV